LSRLLDKYKNEVIPAMINKFNYKNVMQVPKLEKIVINMACGDAVGNAKVLESAIADLTAIAGQKPVITRARKSLAAWKLRKGMAIGCKVTLRGNRMYEFLDKFMNIALPRVRDFRGVSSKSFDGRGNYAIGVKEQLIFPEIDYDKIDKIRGMDIIITTTAHSDEEARQFLSFLGMPFSIS
jgi:large subunit ribosomal protein L5